MDSRSPAERAAAQILTQRCRNLEKIDRLKTEIAMLELTSNKLHEAMVAICPHFWNESGM